MKSVSCDEAIAAISKLHPPKASQYLDRLSWLTAIESQILAHRAAASGRAFQASCPDDLRTWIMEWPIKLVNWNWHQTSFFLSAHFFHPQSANVGEVGYFKGHWITSKSIKDDRGKEQKTVISYTWGIIVRGDMDLSTRRSQDFMILSHEGKRIHGTIRLVASRGEHEHFKERELAKSRLPEVFAFDHRPQFDQSLATLEGDFRVAQAATATSKTSSVDLPCIELTWPGWTAKNDIPIAQILRDYDTFPSSQNHPISAVVARAINGWKRFIAPYTQPTIVNSSPGDPLLAYVVVLLSGMASALEQQGQQANYTSSQIVPMWPSIWAWLRTLHVLSQRSHTATYKSAISLTMYYGAVVRMLCASFRADPPTPLSLLIKSTKEVTDMMASIWIEEGRNIGAINRFQGSLFTAASPSGAPSEFLPYIVHRCEGGAEEVVQILFRRMKQMATPLAVEWEGLQHDLKLINYQLRPELQPERDFDVKQVHGQPEPPDNPEPPILRAALLSHPAFMTVMVNLLSLFLRKPLHSTVGLATFLSYPLLLIAKHFDIKGHESASQLMDTTIVALIVRISRTHGSERNLAVVTGHILQSFCKYFIYKASLVALGRCIALALPGGEAAFRPGGDQDLMGQSILTLQRHHRQWAQIYHSDEPQYSTDCGYPQCMQTDSGPTFRRCSGCQLVQYCSKSRQGQHWRGHKTLCAEMACRRAPVGLSGPG
ncbi:hypothetical protein FIBSPDRAFT_936397, partial [Athelia psychrophila]